VSSSLSDGFAKRMAAQHAPGPALHDGSRVGIVGGGPAGSMFGYFLLRMAESAGLTLEVDIFEPRDFSRKGPAGCNHCGGVVSESLVQRLATEGINLPTEVVQRGIDSYTLHTDVGTVRIDTPVQEKRIAAVYRGNGPRHSEAYGYASFDGYLLSLVGKTGARPIRRLVTGMHKIDNGMRLSCADGFAGDYDLVAVASGVNSRLLEQVADLRTGHRLPETLRAFIGELELGQDVIERYLGTSMHVFLLDLPRLEFAALIPKGDFVTLCLLGEEVDDQLIEAFISRPEVRHCFRSGQVPAPACHCFPSLNVRPAVPCFDDRVVMIGDSGVTRLYKDGIGSAYRTAKAAARTAVFHGISAQDFRAHFLPTLRRIDRDNDIGRLIFKLSRQMQRMPFSRRALLRMTIREQQKRNGAKHLSQVLWDVFTGSAPYREVLLRAMHPAFVGGLMWNLVAANLKRVGKVQAPPLQPAPRHVTRICPEQRDGLPPCQAGCPNHTDVRGWLATITQRDKLGLSQDQAYERAWEQIVALNPFPATLGRICPHPCESNCNRAEKDGAVSVNQLERFIGDWALDRGLALPKPQREAQRDSIGVIGAGPAGLSFAYQMVRRGYPVTVYESRSRAGGMLSHGIPGFRLPRRVVDSEVQRIAEAGVELRLNEEVGKDVSLQTLRSRHDVLFLGIGARKASRLGVPGEDGPGVQSGIAFLESLRQGDATELGQRVVVVGGGNTAIDAARAARRQGAEVVLLYRRTRAEMPAASSEVDDALNEGIRIEYLAAPKAIRRDGAVVHGVLVERMTLGEADASGRRSPLPVEGGDYGIAADSVIVAISQEPDWKGLEELFPAGRLIGADADGLIADGIWVGGDDRGAGLAVLAVAQGRQAAEAVDADLRASPAPARSKRSPVPGEAVNTDSYETRPRSPKQRLPTTEWLTEPGREIDQTISEAGFLEEAGRCLSCGSCFGCQQCWMYCSASAVLRVDKIQPGAYFALSLDRCLGCGKCIEVCPCGFLGARGGPVH